jgi:hypothetical protein
MIILIVRLEGPIEILYAVQLFHLDEVELPFLSRFCQLRALVISITFTRTSR